ncbi:MAG: chloride channel protein [Alphaproteobacteria bacterium]|nr:chloride channel protein [Alphaproteobacteria bacterium]
MQQENKNTPRTDEDAGKDSRHAGSSNAGKLAARISALHVQAKELLDAKFGVNLRDFMSDRQMIVWALALAISILVAYAAIAFRWLIGIAQLPWLGTASERVATAAAATPFWVVLAAPAIGGVIVGFLLQRFMPGRRAHGVADVIEARALHNSHIDPKVGLFSALLAAISIGSGASVGREGPIVHLGATIAAFMEERFKLSPGARRTLLACGVAAAVSASFNAPIAGVLFAHEVILTHYAFRALVPTVIASVAAAVISRIHFGDETTFLIPDYSITSYWEFPAFALLGLTCAAVAIIFEVALMATDRIYWRFEMPLWLRTGLGGLAVGSIAVFLPQVLGVGYEATNDALQRELPLVLLLSLIVAKTAATAISLASRFAGGIFSPSLYLGAMTGSAFGLIATSVFPEIGSSQGLYAILGMGAVAASVLGAPLSTTLIVFELTGGYTMTIALLLTVSIAVGVTQAFLGHSLFYWQLGRRGLFLQEGPHKSIQRRLQVDAFMTPVDPEAEPVHLDDGESPWLMPTDTLERALREFDRTGTARIAVVSTGDPTLIIGHADRLKALNLFNKALIDAAVEEHR